jgi:hypothetical protein
MEGMATEETEDDLEEEASQIEPKQRKLRSIGKMKKMTTWNLTKKRQTMSVRVLMMHWG